jgi:hypothetical protein
MVPEDLPIAEFAFPGPLRDQLVAAILDGTKDHDDRAGCGLRARGIAAATARAAADGGRLRGQPGCGDRDTLLVAEEFRLV